MDVRELAVPGCFEFLPRTYEDARGSFLEWFRAEDFERALGHPLAVAQANHSVSRRGTLRGVHFALVPPGQAKYVYCPRGAVIDVVLDVRAGSPTFGVSDSARLDQVHRRALYICEGVGHAFLALEDDTALTYLCSTGYRPSRERTVDPLDPALALPWPDDVELILSERDRAAPTLAAARAAGEVPAYDECLAWYAQLRGEPVEASE